MLIMLVAFTFSGFVFGQNTVRREPPKGSLTSGTIDSQFIYLYAISKTQDGFEHVRQANLELIRKNVADTIRSLSRRIVELQTQQDNHQATVNNLTDSLQTLRSELEAAQLQKDSFSFAGISLRKGIYSLIMWGIVIILALTLVYYIYRFNQSNVVTKDTRKAIAELQAEFDQHRKRAMEKEQKLKRQLQDEINKRMG